MDNYKAENQEQEIDLVSLFFAVAHRYKQMAAAAVICAVLFGGFGVVKGMLNQRAIDEAIANGEEVPRTSAEQQTKTKKIMICLSKTGELTSLQSYCDKEMGRIVSQLRTVLKENGQSTELADQVMSTYKAEKSQRYAELKNKLYNG